MTKQLSSETVDTVDNGTKTSVENVVENAAKSKVEAGTKTREVYGEDLIYERHVTVMNSITNTVNN